MAHYARLCVVCAYSIYTGKKTHQSVEHKHKVVMIHCFRKCVCHSRAIANDYQIMKLRGLDARKCFIRGDLGQ